MLHCNSIRDKQSIRAALYARVSSEQQAQAGTIHSQIQAVVERAARDGVVIDDELRFVDEGHSGATLVRPALERLRDSAAAGTIDRLYVLCPDRLARSYAYQMLMVDELQRCGVELVFVNRELGKTPEDNLLLQVQGMVAEYERAKIIERCRRGKLHAARQGSVNVLGGAPYGYRYIPAAEGLAGAQYNVHLPEAAVVQQIFQWIGLERASIGQACKWLKTRGISSPKGEDHWDRSTVWSILRRTKRDGRTKRGELKGTRAVNVQSGIVLTARVPFSYPGNRPSHERADEYLDKAIQRCREAGFKHVLARGDTDFMQTWKLDEWDQSGDVTFIFGADARKEMIARAEQLNPADWRRLERPAKYQHKTDPPELRARPDNIKEQVVVERGYKNLVLQYEDAAEFTHRPDLCKKACRMIALRKKISVEKGQEKLFDEYRCFFYITNDRTSTAEEIVFLANDRCDQENLIAQLKDTGTGSMRNPLDNLYSNWAYMVISSLAWTLKAWCGLLLPAAPGPHHQTHKQQGRAIVKMEFATFVNSLMRLPCQIIKSGRRIIYRLMSWNPWVSPLLRLHEQMRLALRC